MGCLCLIVLLICRLVLRLVVGDVGVLVSLVSLVSLWLLIVVMWFDVGVGMLVVNVVCGGLWKFFWVL